MNSSSNNDNMTINYLKKLTSDDINKLRQVHLMISTPCFNRSMYSQYVLSIFHLQKTLQEIGIKYAIDINMMESLIPRARNQSLGIFMNEGDFTHLLFIDADIEFKSEAVIDLLLSPKEVTCCAYPTKGIHLDKLINSIKDNPDSTETLFSRGYNYAFNIHKPVYIEGNLLKVRHASNGFMMIKRSIIEKLQPKYPELTISNTRRSYKWCGLFCCMIKQEIYLSEDYSFCERVYENGGDVWINIDHNLSHIGNFTYTSDIKNHINNNNAFLEYNRSPNENSKVNTASDNKMNKRCEYSEAGEYFIQSNASNASNASDGFMEMRKSMNEHGWE
jgi:hypothetical protein